MMFLEALYLQRVPGGGFVRMLAWRVVAVDAPRRSDNISNQRK